MFGLFRPKTMFDDKAVELYEECLRASRAPFLYRDLGVADTFDGRFEALVLHLFMVIHRLQQEGGQKELEQALFDVTFAALDQALRNEGIGDMGVPKRIRKMMLVFNSRMHGYSEALDKGELAQALRDALYGSCDDIDAVCLSGMVAYLEEQGALLDCVSVEDIAQGKSLFKG